MGCGSSSAAEPSQTQCEKSPGPVKLVAGDVAIIRNCLNARLNGERVVCESYNAGLNEWLVKGEKFPLSVGMSLGEKFLEKLSDECDNKCNEAQTLGQSLYNSAYFCNVLRAEVMQEGVIELDFDVHGDGSLGPLQDPSDSILGSQKAHSCSYEICDVNRRIKGTLVFSADLHGSNAQFRFGSGGYSFVELQVKRHVGNVVGSNVKYEH